MARKRSNNEGSIYKRKNGTWRAQVTLDGRRLGKTFKTQREARKWLQKTNRQIDDGLRYANTQITLDEFIANWLISTKASRRPSTWSVYETATRLYILPHLGKIKLKDLRPGQIQWMYNHMLEQKVGVPTVLKVHAVLHSALAQAEKMGMINHNPVSATQPPKEPTREMAILTDSQVSQMLIALQGHRLEALIHLAVVSGMRQMELLGLKWTDLDWIRRTIKVERQLDRPTGKGIQFSAPKTRFGKRSVALGRKTIEVLRNHYERQQGDRLRVGENWNEHDLIFTNRNGGPLHPRNLLRDFKLMLKRAGLPVIRFHDLRHTAASLMLNSGIAPIIVSRRLGHARASITLDIYGHLIPSMQSEAAEKIDELITPIPLHRVAPDLSSEKAGRL
jgi:integrase